MNQLQNLTNQMSRRHFFGRSASGLGIAALGSLLGQNSAEAAHSNNLPTNLPMKAPTAKRVIYLFQSGAPSQMDMFDYKPEMAKRYGEELPESVRGNQRLTGMTAQQGRLCVAPTIYNFEQRGQSGAWMSDLLPHTAKITDDLCIVKSMHTDAINHDPAITFLMTGSQLPGRPSMGSWLSYGLGSENSNLPAFVVMSSKGSGRKNGQPLYQRLWGSGFIPSQHQGCSFWWRY
jgi:hypothetical protein